MKYRIVIQMLLLLQIGILVTAQTSDCPVEIESALGLANEICVGTGRNQVCYGNNDVTIMPYEPIEIEFDSPGDIAELADIRTLSLSAFDLKNGHWGVAIMRLLANLDPAEADDVTVLLFGDVEIEDASGKQEIQVVSANAYVNLRRLPNSSSPVMDSVAVNDVVQATGRLEDNSWVRVVNPDTNITGWILSSLLSDVDFDALQVVGTNEPYFSPMQAFYFESGTTTGACASIPRDGIVVQTPEGLRRVTLWVNEVTIDFLSGTGNTATLLTQEDGSMSVNVMEGSVFVSSDTGGYVAVAGSSIIVKKPDSGQNVSVSKPVATSPDVINSTPVQILDRDVNLPAPANDQLIEQANELPVSVDTAIADENAHMNTPDNPSQDAENGNPNTNANNRPDTPPGQSDNSCPGNSCNAPGRNKSNNKKNK